MDTITTIKKLSVKKEYDVIVCGGGTSGVAAAIAIGGPGETLTLSSLDGKEVYKTEEAIRCVGFAAIETDALTPGSVYSPEKVPSSFSA